MSLTALTIVPAIGLSARCEIGQVLPIGDVHTSMGGWSVFRGNLVLDLSERTLLVCRDTAVVIDIIESSGLSLLGFDEDGRVAIFSDDLSWDYQVYDLSSRSWLDNDDPDFPRFTLEEDAVSAWLLDLDTNIRYHLAEQAPIIDRQSA